MSPREAIQNRLVEFLTDNPNSFNAPYGILSGLDALPNGKGKVRTITFGVSRYLDATICIWSPNRIQIRGQGGLAYKVEGDYSDVESAIARLKTLVYR
jgi:hypothetical protein